MQQDFPEVFWYGQWVHPLKGLYTGDLTLVWSSSTTLRSPADLTSDTHRQYVPILLLTRLHQRDTEQSKHCQGKRRRLDQPLPMRIEEKMIDTTCNSGDSIYSDKHFYNRLLLAQIDCDNLFHLRPLYTELYLFVKVGLDVRLWKRYLA